MHFLHTDAREAARALCVQDMVPYLNKVVRALHYCHQKRLASKSPLHVWASRSVDNYCWLAYFCKTLGQRISSQQAFVSRHHSDIYNLQICVPTRLRRFATVDEFPNLLKQRYPDAPTLVSAYRLDYLSKRRYNAKWGKDKAPGWFARLSYTVPDARRGPSTTLRNFATRCRRSNHSGRGIAEW